MFSQKLCNLKQILIPWLFKTVPFARPWYFTLIISAYCIDACGVPFCIIQMQKASNLAPGDKDYVT